MLNGVRVMYVLSNVIIFGIYYYCQMQIEKKKGKARTLCSSMLRRLTSDADMTVIKYVEPAAMGSAEEPKAVTTTVQAYDKQQLRTLYKSQLMGVGMIAVMHLYFKFTNPLLMQSLLPLKGAFEGNLVKVHLLGKPATGELKRPWKASGGMLAGLQKGEVKTDKKSIQAAEKAGRGGAKEE